MRFKKITDNKPKSIFNLASGTILKTWELFKIGKRLPTLSIHWYATINDEFVSYAYRLLCW